MRRVSNDPAEGEKGAGADGWHIDGYYLEYPFMSNVMHHVECSEGGETWISPMKELVESLEPEVMALWDKLYFMTGNLKGKEFFHPFICKHPVTGDHSMVFHLGEGKCWGLIELPEILKGKIKRRFIHIEKMFGIIKSLSEQLHHPDRKYCMNWEKGDVGFIDNRAVCHLASPAS